MSNQIQQPVQINVMVQNIIDILQEIQNELEDKALRNLVLIQNENNQLNQSQSEIHYCLSLSEKLEVIVKLAERFERDNKNNHFGQQNNIYGLKALGLKFFLVLERENLQNYREDQYNFRFELAKKGDVLKIDQLFNLIYKIIQFPIQRHLREVIQWANNIIKLDQTQSINNTNKLVSQEEENKLVDISLRNTQDFN